jgi:topoisomerase IV subunit A
MVTKKRVMQGPGEDRHVEQQTLRQFGKKNMTTYAVAVNLDRSVPDMYDGLKPVQRRILWGMSAMSSRSSGVQKAAEFVGFVLGKLHPHGDGSCYGAMVTMVNMPTPSIFGRGNWGSMIDGPAAYRYTECKLTNFGWSFLEPEYIVKEVTSFVPNFNDRWVEPVTLPAQLPNVLLNGGEGIGVGITTLLPTFTVESVIEVLLRMFKGEKLQALDFAKALKFTHKWGGRLVKSKENREQWNQMFTSSQASIQFESEIEVDRDHKRMVIREWAPGVNLESFVKKIQGMAETQRCYNSEGSTTYTIECKSAYNFNQFDKFVEKVQKATQSRRAFKINVTKREATTVDGITNFDTKFLALSVPELLVQWCRMRVQLELRSLADRIRRTLSDIDYDQTMIRACDHIDEIIKIIRRSEDPEAALVAKLKYKPHQAKWICDLQLRRISKLDEAKYKKDLKEHQAQLKQLQAWEKKPRTKIVLDLERMRELIKKDQAFQSREDNQTLEVV